MKKLMIASTLALLSSVASAEVLVENAYARAVPPGQLNSATFLQLHNKGSEMVKLVNAASPAAKNVELHTHEHDNGVMRMRQVESIPVAANDSTTLQPGGYHIMLIGLNQDMAPGSEIDLKLSFSDGSSATLKVPVKMVMAKQKMNHHNH
ncbi:copper chaperone PCu(A)C [Marinobacterium jannaschii]|uniref:copper chaperone PCu(A)C n=1 Tax=Marinobacterium jannaschii TaxID=64970 RepID=UPI000488BF39|nr:copper chaperone PCu(A)C [Marinobacterium jannaschii]